MFYRKCFVKKLFLSILFSGFRLVIPNTDEMRLNRRLILIIACIAGFYAACRLFATFWIQDFTPEDGNSSSNFNKPSWNSGNYPSKKERSYPNSYNGKGRPGLVTEMLNKIVNQKQQPAVDEGGGSFFPINLSTIILQRFNHVTTTRTVRHLRFCIDYT